MSVPTLEGPPQFIHEAEALLCTGFFYDEQRSAALYDDYEALAGEELGARSEVYLSALRVLAQARRQERPSENPPTDFDTKAWNEAWRNQLTPHRLGEIVLHFADDLYPLSRKLVILNNAERSFEEGLASEGLFDHQVPYLEKAVAALQRGSERVQLPAWWEGDEAYYMQGTTVTGPTGIGKTAVMARLAKALGAGQPVELAGFGHTPPARIVIVSPTQSAIARLLGYGGKDLFRRLCPGVQLGGLYAREQTPDADVVFSSIKMFKKHFSDGQLAGHPVDFLFVDEDHHLTEPQFLEAFLRNWHGTTFGFSATPAYSESQDVRHILRHEVKIKDVLEYAGRELSDMQIYTMIVHPQDIGAMEQAQTMDTKGLRELRQRAVNEKTRDFVLPLIEEGRRGMIFCEPGQVSRHAKMMAAMFDGLELSDGRKIRAETLGDFRGGSDSGPNRRLLQEFDEGKIDVLTTTLMGQESLHAEEVNFVITACKISSSLKMYQIGGRGLEKSNRFDTCVLANINTVGFGQDPYHNKTFAGVYTGEDFIRQGMILSRKHPHGGRKPSVGVMTEAASHPGFTEGIQRMLDRIDHKTLAEAFFGARGAELPITAGYICLTDIANGADIPANDAREHLHRAGYRREIRSEVRNGRIVPVSYYEPAAGTYFTENPQPPQDGFGLKQLRKFAKSKDIVSLADLEAALHLHRKYILNACLTDEERAAGGKMRVPGVSAGKPFAWPKKTGEKILERLQKLLAMPEHLVLAGVVAGKLAAKHGTVMEFIRRNRETLDVEDLPRGNRTHPGLPWRSVEPLALRYGVAEEGILDFDIARLPTSSDEKDPAKLEYARKIQRNLGTPLHWLPPEKEDQ